MSGGSISSRTRFLVCLFVICGAAFSNVQGTRMSFVVGGVSLDGLPPKVEFIARFRKGDTVCFDSLPGEVARLKMVLRDQGYLWSDAAADTVETDKGTLLRFAVSAGERAVINRWSVVTDDQGISSDIASMLSGPETPFTSRVLDASQARILGALEGKGHPLATVELSSVSESAHYVSPVLSLRVGPLVVLDFMSFVGDFAASRRVLLRVARFEPGRRFSRRLLSSWSRNLERSRLVAVSGENLVAADGAHGVELQLQHRRSSRATGGFGYSPDIEQRFTGMVDVELRNILNTGRSAQARWESYSGRTSYYLSYTEPWLLGWWLSLTGTAEHRVQDTTLSNTRFFLNGDLQATPDLTVGLESGYSQVAGSDTADRSSTLWGGTGLELDLRDRDVLPRRGALVKVRSTAGERRTAAGPSSFIGRFEPDVELVGPALAALVPVNSGHVRYVHSPTELSLFEQAQMGGARSLRGYREDQFASTFVGWWNAELHYRFGSAAAVYPFLDAGVLDSGDGWDFVPGYGLGLQARTRIGLVGADYGIAPGESPLRGKVHFRYQTDF
ncbi:MAG: BamA/TamA family outer membrane protein [candidate division WOR-3 bacterium]|nr:MAG: BamA/TamA family outer membrane protein [candidate division WOR-3 bacterium]